MALICLHAPALNMLPGDRCSSKDCVCILFRHNLLQEKTIPTFPWLSHRWWTVVSGLKGTQSSSSELIVNKGPATSRSPQASTALNPSFCWDHVITGMLLRFNFKWRNPTTEVTRMLKLAFSNFWGLMAAQYLGNSDIFSSYRAKCKRIFTSRPRAILIFILSSHS